MDSGLKQRLIGAAVLVALAVIFLPMLVRDPAPDSGVSELSFQMPPAPDAPPQSIRLPLASADAPMLEAAADAAISGGDEDADAEQSLPPPAANGHYVVHFAAFATDADAELTMRQLQARGLPAFTQDITLYGRPAVRVRIGPYQTQAEAEIVRVRAAQVRPDVQPRVFMLIDDMAAERTMAALEQSAASSARAASGVGFVVQLGAFSNASGAVALSERLRRAGIVAFTDTVNTSRGIFTRVNAGPVSSRAEANQLKARIKSAVELEGVVRSHP